MFRATIWTSPISLLMARYVKGGTYLVINKWNLLDNVLYDEFQLKLQILVRENRIVVFFYVSCHTFLFGARYVFEGFGKGAESGLDYLGGCELVLYMCISLVLVQDRPKHILQEDRLDSLVRWTSLVVCVQNCLRRLRTFYAMTLWFYPSVLAHGPNGTKGLTLGSEHWYSWNV
jgi:hypothetical protein